LTNRVPDVVVITDRVECLPFGIVGASLEQLGIEDLFLDVGVHVQFVGQRAPHPTKGSAIGRRLRLQVIQLRELFAKPIVVGQYQHGDVCHRKSQRSFRQRRHRRRGPMLADQFRRVDGGGCPLSGLNC
jgi:hypothetical protein